MTKMMSERESKMRKVIARVGEGTESALGVKTALEKDRNAEFERVKTSLMNDLLTGKKRVKVDGKEAV
jgi:hypothetical protein